MNRIYSVKYLLEAVVDPLPSPLSKTFEETIVLLESESKESIEVKIIEHCRDYSYENAIGGTCTWKFVKILDIFELTLSDTFEKNVNFIEVYSRFLPFDKMITAEEVIELYSLDK